MQDCVIGALKDKTVILVTHQVEFLHAVDLILVRNERMKYYSLFQLPKVAPSSNPPYL